MLMFLLGIYIGGAVASTIIYMTSDLLGSEGLAMDLFSIFLWPLMAISIFLKRTLPEDES